MIYEETYNYLMRHVSRTEFDVCLVSLLHSDWEGNLRLTLDELAAKAGTKKKYLKEIVKKFLSEAKGRFVFSEVRNREGLLYHVNISKPSHLYDKRVDKYCKKYTFFYSPEFQVLPINAKRLILMAAFELSKSGHNKVILKTKDIIPAVHNEKTLPFTKGRMLEAINAIQKSGIKEIINVGFASHLFGKEEVVYFEFDKNTLNNFETNRTELSLLQKKIYEAGFNYVLPEEYYIEIEKVGSYIFNEFRNKEKEIANTFGPAVSAKDELQKLARFIYDEAIKRLAPALQLKKEELNEPKKVSAYFSAIVHELVLKESFSYLHQYETVKEFLEDPDFHKIHRHVTASIHGRDMGALVVDKETSPIREKANLHKRMYLTLKKWCKDWVLSRVEKPKAEKDNGKMNVTAQYLKEKASKQVNKMKTWMDSARNKIADKKELKTFLNLLVDELDEYLGIEKNNKIQNKEKIELPY